MSAYPANNWTIGHRFVVADAQRDLLGRGGMGEVYRGVDMQTGQPVAIKALRPEVADSPGLLARFVREGEALRQLNHPNIVKLVEAVQERNAVTGTIAYYLVMEYVAGGSLQDLLDRPARCGENLAGLPIEQMLAIALEVADALTRAHHLGIIHRDLKPGNVLLAEDGTPRLTDFGIAYLPGTSRLTETGMLVGTVDYLSPQVCRGEQPDTGADIWSFGVLLWEMLTGATPFGQDNVLATLTAITTRPLPDLEALRPDMPVALADLIYRMLEKERAQRIPSVRMVGAELETIQRVGESANQRTDAPYSVFRVPSSRFVTPTPPSEAVPHNLPVQTTPFVGREAELAELGKLLANPEVRLLSVLGPGGMGKTRLALQAANAELRKPPRPGDLRSHGEGMGVRESRYPNGVFFASLAPLRSADALVPTIAEAIGFSFYQGLPPRQQLLDYLRNKTLLLVLDNFEHLLACPEPGRGNGVDLVTDLLQTAPGVKVLATSRVRLNVQSEHGFFLSGLDFPDWETPEDALEYSAVKLFMQGARRARPGFELHADDLRYVARICRLAEGMPLGILLAAAWIEMLTPQEIADEMSRSLDFLVSEQRDAPERQRSMRAVFDYSWRLLTERERDVFAALSVFRGGWTREAAQAVAGAGLRELMALVNKSLIQRTASGRYQMHELLRQYAEERLNGSPDSGQSVRDRHSEYYAEFLHRKEMEHWIGRTQESLFEMDNIRAAWRRMISEGQVAKICKCLYSLGSLYESWGWLYEPEAMFGEAVEMLRSEHTGIPTTERKAALGVALGRQGFFANLAGQFDRAMSLHRESQAVLREVGARRDLALANCAIMWTAPFEQIEAAQLTEESLSIARETGDYLALSQALTAASALYLESGERAEFEVCINELLTFAKKANDRRSIALAFAYWGHLLKTCGEYTVVKQYYRESLSLYEATETQWAIGRLNSHLGDLALAMENDQEAGAYHRAALSHYRDGGVYWHVVPSWGGGCYGIPVSLQRLGDVALAAGNLIEARHYYRQALEAASDRPELGLKLHVLLGPLRLLAQEGCAERAAELGALLFLHPDSIDETKDKARVLVKNLRAELPADVFSAVQERGRARDLQATVQELLEELERQAEEASGV